MRRPYLGITIGALVALLACSPASAPTPATGGAGSSVGPKTFACGSAQCSAQGQICCDDGEHGAVCVEAGQTPEWCALLIAQRSCDSKTNAPCLASEKCCHVQIGGPLTMTLTCADAKSCRD